jgi:hypothetical protein
VHKNRQSRITCVINVNSVLRGFSHARARDVVNFLSLKNAGENSNEVAPVVQRANELKRHDEQIPKAI